MNALQTKTKAKAKSLQRSPNPASDNGAWGTHGASHSSNSRLGAFYSAGPVFGLGAPVQTKVAIGRANDPFEREADAVADRVTSGATVQPSTISSVTPSALAQTMSAEEKKLEQKVEAKKPVQKAEAKKPEVNKPEQKPIQKAEEKTPEQKVEEKKPVQKAETKKPEEKKPEQKPMQKAEAKPPEQKVEEKKPVQKAEAQKPEEKKPEAMPLQRLSEPEPVENVEEKPVQTDTGLGSPATVPAPMTAAADQAIATKGSGSPLNPATQSTLESRLGTDFDQVRVHDDSAAQEASSALNARAFTHGSDIWLGRGASQNDMRLMAHEATHVVQQSGGVQRMVQRTNGTGGAAGGGGAAGTGTEVDADKKLITIPQLKIPAFKANELPPEEKQNLTIPQMVVRPKGEEEQRSVWKENVESAVTNTLPTKLQGLPGIVPDKTAEAGIAEDKSDNKNKRYFLQIGGGKNYLIGTPQELAPTFVIPRWGPSGQPKLLDVDHKHEIQLGGKACIGNLQLLDASANRSAGSRISRQINKTIEDAVAPERKKNPGKIPATVKEVRKQFTITYKQIVGDKDKDPAGADDKWTPGDVKAVEGPFSKLKALSIKEVLAENLVGVGFGLPEAGKHQGIKEVLAENLVGEPTRLIVYPLPGGGKPKEIRPWDATQTSPQPFTDKDWLKGFTPSSVSYVPGRGGTLVGQVFTTRMRRQMIPPQSVNWNLIELGGLPYTCYIEPGSLLPSMQFAQFKALSPLEFQEVLLNDTQGLVARGKLAPSIPIFKRLDIDVLVTGESISLSKTFTKDDFALPGPIQVTEASLTISVGTDGLEVGGDVFLEVERLGKGKVSGKVGTNEGIELSGDFEFDTRLFDPAKIHVGYADGTFSGSGEIGIKEGKVRGIKSAGIKAAFEGDKITASGSVKPSIPGIEQGDLRMSYAPDAGLVIAGSLELKKDIPGIAGGSVQAQVIQKPGADNYIVKASGTAQPKIPGISTSLSVTYDDGAFDITGTAAYEKGMLKGSVTVGATNRPVGEDGRPSGPPADQADKITLYGGGSVTIKIAPWLPATAAIKILPNGEIEVTGSIGLPKTLDIFPEKKLDKNIFTIGIDIPIVGVAVAGQRIGIFANISGGLDLSAGIGPGQLQEVGLSITYNPAHEDQTHVTGGAKLHIPAHAGLRLFVRGGLGVGIPIVSAQAGLEIGGQLGLEGAVDAGVQVDWTPAQGLKLDALGEIYVEPKLKFDITGFVLVEADLLLTTIELYSKRWQLAGFEYGSGLRFGVKFPIHYEEGKPFDISLSDVQFQVPDIKPKEVLSDLIKRIA